ncbi:MAG: precorrin-2 C(20)-methyltransferase [Alphaproteobacteria bacterium]|nr:precorrin-2 C(20)-methyltransferase [Alphaproteobacteria bacterium]
MSGTVFGLGVGPGDPELITLKALRVLKSAAVIAYPAPDQGDSFARAIIAPHLAGNQIEIVIRTPMETARFPAQEVYDQAAVDIGGHARAGRDVAVLCQGDPFFYGSFMYLFGRLTETCPVSVIPGVSSLTACAAALGAPLAGRNDVLTIIPAPLAEDDIVARLSGADAAAIIKIGRHAAKVRRAIERCGLVARARYIERATLVAQRILPLAQIQDGDAPYFSLVLVHRRGEAWR